MKEGGLKIPGKRGLDCKSRPARWELSSGVNSFLLIGTTNKPITFSIFEGEGISTTVNIECFGLNLSGNTAPNYPENTPYANYLSPKIGLGLGAGASHANTKTKIFNMILPNYNGPNWRR